MSKIKKLLRPGARVVWRTTAYAKAMTVLDEAAWRLSKLLPKPPEVRVQTLVMSPAGDGNIGDHAMLNAFLENCDGPVTVLSSGVDSTLHPDLNSSRLVFKPMRSLFSYPPFIRFWSVFKFSRLLASSRIFIIHGADTMDGSQISASLARLSLCRLASLEGIPSAVLGFSWSDESPKVVSDAIRTVSANTLLFPRDPLALRRLEELDVSNLLPVTDMAFSLNTVETPPGSVSSWLRETASCQEEFVILNVSGLIANRFDQRKEIELVVSQIHKFGARVLFLPHVLRKGDDDLAICKEMHALLGQPKDFLVEELLAPEQVRYIASRAKLTITGRMHLSILSLGIGTPAIALSTAGKVEGLFELFGLSEFVVDPVPGYGATVVCKLKTLSDGRAQAVQAIEAALPSIRERSLMNFSTHNHSKASV